MTVSLGLIDARFETDAVYDFLSRSPLKALLHASMGKGIGPSKKPMNEYRKDQGDLVGWNWRMDAKTLGKGRYVSYDTYPWKSFIAEALLAEPGSSGSFYIFGKSVVEHPLLTIHLLSEHRKLTYDASARKVEVWELRPGQREQHWWDGVVGSAVAASMLGVKFSAAFAAGDNSVIPDPSRPKATREDYELKRREFEQRRGNR
jgi:hypothetical protein